MSRAHMVCGKLLFFNEAKGKNELGDVGMGEALEGSGLLVYCCIVEWCTRMCMLQGLLSR